VQHLKRFLRLVVQPLAGAWSIFGLGIPGAIGLLLWGTDHPLAAFVWVLLIMVALLGWAGYRLQRRLDDTVSRQGFLDSLGLQMTMGQQELDVIEHAGVKFQDAVEEMRAAGQIDEERWSEVYNDVSKHSGEWEEATRKRIRSVLNYSYEARFMDDSGLTPAKPAAKVTDNYCVRRWQHHEMRLQRLHEIIRELQERWEV
jgi:hypothetical protein